MSVTECVSIREREFVCVCVCERESALWWWVTGCVYCIICMFLQIMQTAVLVCMNWSLKANRSGFPARPPSTPLLLWCGTIYLADSEVKGCCHWCWTRCSWCHTALLFIHTHTSIHACLERERESVHVCIFACLCICECVFLCVCDKVLCGVRAPNLHIVNHCGVWCM